MKFLMSLVFCPLWEEVMVTAIRQAEAAAPLVWTAKNLKVEHAVYVTVVACIVLSCVP